MRKDEERERKDEERERKGRGRRRMKKKLYGKVKEDGGWRKRVRMKDTALLAKRERYG